jgi:hypothetical protein
MLSGSDRVRLALGFEGYNMKKLYLALAFLPLAWVMPVHAVPLPQFTYSFGASGFAPFDPEGEPPPTDPVTGSLIYEAATANSPIEGLVSIDLTIDGHIYDTGQLTFGIVSGRQRVGGNLTGGNRVAPGTNAFSMEWDPATLVLESFRYSSTNREGDFYIASVLTPSNPIAEPATLALVVLAMSLIAIFAGRRRGIDRSASLLNRWRRPALS